MSVLKEIRQALAELELVSHAPVRNYDGRSAPSADDDIGGRRPSGRDGEFPPRKPNVGAKAEVWEEYRQEFADWLLSYQRRTPAYFRAELRRRGPGDPLLEEIRVVVEAWRKSPPQPVGVEPERESFEWKCKIANDDSGKEKDRCDRYSISAATLYRYRARYRRLRRAA